MNSIVIGMVLLSLIGFEKQVIMLGQNPREIILVGDGQIDYLSLTGTVRGMVRDSDTNQGIDNARVEGLASTTRTWDGKYLLSPMPGCGTLKVTHTDYKTKSSGYCAYAGETVYKNFLLTCHDADDDGVCDYMPPMCIGGGYDGEECSNNSDCGCVGYCYEQP